MNPLLWLSLMSLCLGAVNSQNAKTCAFCHATAGVCTQKTDYVTCSCAAGFVGDGITCTPIASCTTETCCSQGYNWDNRVGYKTCTDINECADATLNKCVLSSTCVNRNGIYLCSSTKTVKCPNETCAFDQDCLNVGGAVQCADPCLNYQLLNGNSRLSTINSTGVFMTDRYNFGWFRYNGTTGLRIQEGCVGGVKCGSAEPFTLNGSHPAIGDGVVMMTLLTNSGSICTAAGTIPVKACPGGYYIYKFSGSLKSEVYCTDPSPFVIPTLPPTTTTTTTPTTTTPTTTTATTTTPTTTTPTTTTPTTTTPTTTTPTTTTPTTTTPTTTTPTTTTPTTTPPTTTTPTTTTPTTTTPTTTTPTTTTPTTTIPTTTTPTTTTPTTTTPTTTTPTTTTQPPTTTPVPTTSLKTTIQPGQNVTVTTLKSSNTISVTSSSGLVNGTWWTTLELNETTAVYIEVKTISPTTVTTNINSSVTPFYSIISIGPGLPVTFTDRPAPQNSGNVTVVPNQQLFMPDLYISKPAQTQTITNTFTVDNVNLTSTTTTTTITTEEVIVI